MKWFKILFDLYIISNIHVAVSVVMLYMIFNNAHPDWNYAGFLFWGTVFSYGSIRLFFWERGREIFKNYYKKYRILFFMLLVVSFLFSLYYFFQLPVSVRFSIIPLAVITLFYQSNLPFFSFRQNGILKIVTVSFVWAMLAVVIPGIYYENLSFLHLKFIFVFTYVFLLTLSFDQRDILIDQRDLGTLPQLFPDHKKLIYIAIGLLLLGISFFIFKGKELYIAFIVVMLSLILSWHSDNKKNFYYTAFIIESLPIFWLFLIYISKNFI